LSGNFRSSSDVHTLTVNCNSYRACGETDACHEGRWITFFDCGRADVPVARAWTGNRTPLGALFLGDAAPL